MKKYLNKAIIYKELKGSWWIILTLLFIVTSDGYFQFRTLLDRVQYSDLIRSGATTIYDVSNYFTDARVFPLIFILLIIISQTIMGADKKSDFERIAAMPFTRRETIISKLVTGELLLVIPLVLNFLMILSMYYYNYAIIHSSIKLWIIVKLLVLNLLNYSAILTFLMLIQSIVGKKIAGSVLGLIFMFVPIGLPCLIAFVSTMHLNNFNIAFSISDGSVEKIAGWLLVPFYNQLGMFRSMGYLTRVVILICLISTFIALTYYSYKKNQFERTGNVLMFSFLEPIFKIGVAVCFGLTGFVFIYGIGTDLIYRWNLQKSLILFVSDIGIIVVGALAYFITNKYIKANRE